MKGGELFLINSNIPIYRQANRFNHEPKRPRKLLLHKKEIAKLSNGVLREGLTVVPLKMFFNPRGRCKVDIALARGGPNAAVLAGRAGGSIVASVLVGHDGHRGWVYYVAVDPDHGGIAKVAPVWQNE